VCADAYKYYVFVVASVCGRIQIIYVYFMISPLHEHNSMVKLEGLAKTLRHANPTNPPHLQLVELDLRSMMSIREAVGVIMKKNIMLKLIINAAVRTMFLSSLIVFVTPLLRFP